MPYILNTQSSATCPHGATVQLTSTANSVMKVAQAYALLQTDVHSISGCPFMKGTVASPCLMVTWVTGATQTKVNQVPVLLDNSTGLCMSATGPQGTASISSVQSDVQGT